MKTAQSLAESQLGQIEWLDLEQGYCTCPGEAFHTHPSRGRDCQVFLSGVPSIFCFHTSCRQLVEQANRQLRQALARRSAPSACVPLTAREIVKRRERAAYDRLKTRAENCLPRILAQHPRDVSDVFEQSPVRLLDDPADDWRLLLRLFQSEDVLWIGDLYQSGKGHEARFQTVKNWRAHRKAPGPFICPSSFIPGAFSRCQANVKNRRYLVLESDTLDKTQIVSVLSWASQFLHLRAIIDTAGKSLHGWFDYPQNEDVEKELRIIMPILGCDPAMFKPSQPCRLPGAIRGDKPQALLWLDLLQKP